MKKKRLYPDGIKRWILRAVAIASIVGSGCTDDVQTYRKDDEATPSDRLVFTTRLATGSGASATRSSSANLDIVEEQWPLPAERRDSLATRGAIINHLSGTAGVLGFQYGDESNEIVYTPIAGRYNNLEFQFESDRLVSTNSTILWSTIDQPHLNVYAYVPYLPGGTAPDGIDPDAEMTLESENAPPYIDYTVPRKISNQIDLLAARWISKDQKDQDYKDKTIPLTFNHILTAIRFRVEFGCKVKSIEIRHVHNSGRYNFRTGKWEEPETSTADYGIDFKGADFKPNALLNGDSDDTYMILMPQTLPEEAEIVLTCTDKTYTAKIGGKVWEAGKLITYTFHKDRAPETIYFDLAAGDVNITGATDGSGKVTYSGFIYKEDLTTPTEVTNEGEENSGKEPYHFYVYQSTEDNRDGIWKEDVCTPPTYPEVKGPDGQPWSDFITDNTNVESVIESWDKNHNDLVEAAGRTSTPHWINITGNVTCDLTIDNIYSTYQNGDKEPNFRSTAGITFMPTIDTGDKPLNVNNAKVTVNMVGDNRLGAVQYYNPTRGNEIIFEGTGSLTVADVDGKTKPGNNDINDEVGLNANEGSGYWSNHWCTAIGGSDDCKHEESDGIIINSGTIFAGTTKAENCTAIGGGGNSYGRVVINGGTVTAVATTTGTAIGGGIGFGSAGGEGNVEINGGNVYAYNHANRWNIPSSAIGGAGSKSSSGSLGTVTVTGGYVYAYSALGTAIGGGSSFSIQGGDANITITGGEVFAKTGEKANASIGGGTACSRVVTGSSNGGDANITISGNPIIRTGSIGGGGKGMGSGHIGNATIRISGGDIQGQFILAAGTEEGEVPTFTMSGGTIRNSDTADEAYKHVKPEGGAVYLENGTVEIKGGTIENCTAQRGGAIYIQGSEPEPDGTFKASFTMSGGEIKGNGAHRATKGSAAHYEGSGGAVYIQNGAVTLSGNATISGNLAAGGNGGGVFIHRGTLTVKEYAEIRGNATEIRETDQGTYAGGNGGGVYIYSKEADVTVDLLSGKITGNTADRRGGGVCVIQDNSEGHDKTARITIGSKEYHEGHDSDLLIAGNHTLLQGGGVYAKGEKADITINSGTIQDNTVSQYVYNQNVANEGGSVTLNGGDVTYNTVTFHANGGKIDGSTDTSIQKIVTHTNSKLKEPEDCAFLGFRLTGWNTKRSGTGKQYQNGDTMNIHEDMTLYAQWERDNK